MPMDYVFVVILAALVAFTLGALLMKWRSGELTPDNTRLFIYQTIDDAFALYYVKDQPLNEMILEVVRITREKIGTSHLPQADKDYWTDDRLLRIVGPIIAQLYHYAETKQGSPE